VAKGTTTRSSIVEQSLALASEVGLGGLTIGDLAARTGMSKSGLFAHFGAKLDLQMAALDEAARQFTEAVFLPAMKAPRGLKRLRALFDGWISWPQRASMPGGCPIDAAGREYQHQPGHPMHAAVVDRQKTLDRELAKSVQMAVEAGELSKGLDPRQVAFEMLGIIFAFYRTELVLGSAEASERARAAFERLVDTHRP
jgi:AcrR family transcriptional regulator